MNSQPFVSKKRDRMPLGIIDDKRNLHEVKKIINLVISLEKQYRSKSNEELQAMTPILRKRLMNGETEEDIFVDALATVREACFRIKGQFPYPVQLMAATVLQRGDIAEMKTGEGKTLVGALGAYVNALSGKGVHIVTVNEYLARRDFESNGEVLRWLGLSVGLNISNLSRSEKRKAYLCDVMYSTNSELGFDYLRDHLVHSMNEKVQRGLHFALVDEVDSILIDDARTPLIISSSQQISSDEYTNADTFVKSLSSEDYKMDLESTQIELSESGIHKAEQFFRVDNLYSVENARLIHRILKALTANYVFKNNYDYLIQDDAVCIVDTNTGRVMEGRQWNDGLHQAVEAKEGLSIHSETKTSASITYQNFFRLYDKLSGMSGTAKEEQEEFLDAYNMYVVPIPTNRPIQRIDHPDQVFATKKEKYVSIVYETYKRYQTGQPVLIGTISVKTSEIISKLLTKIHIPHQLLNAKNNDLEAHIIAQAGQKGAITIATNMAGRGTDIKLGKGVKELGGLCVLGTERHESRRIDNQLRGRSGRQGDVGESQFFVSMQDDLLMRFNTDMALKYLKKLDGNFVSSPTVSKVIEDAQLRVSGNNYDSRKQVLEYDNVVRYQREAVYKQRDEVLETSDIKAITFYFFKQALDSYIKENNDMIGLNACLKRFANINISIPLLDSYVGKQLNDLVLNKVIEQYNLITEDYESSYRLFERKTILKAIDEAWSNQIDELAFIKTSVFLQRYIHQELLSVYALDAKEAYDKMEMDIARMVLFQCTHARFVKGEELAKRSRYLDPLEQKLLQKKSEQQDEVLKQN